MGKFRNFVIMLGLTGLVWAGFDSCKFNFGEGWVWGSSLSGLDFISEYAGYNGWDNSHRDFTIAARDSNVTAVYYGYVTAFMARETYGYTDCDAGSNNLCTGGADFIRMHRADVIAMYKFYAQNIKAIYAAAGKTPDVIFLVEPDLYQYSVLGSNQRGLLNGEYQNNGGYADIGGFFSEIVGALRSEIPGIRIGIDLSPWIANPAAYYALFNQAQIDFMFTSGGRTEATLSKIRSTDKMLWSGAKSYMGKPVLADCGYGVGGTKDGHHSEWDNVTNLKARIANGVISINQFDARADWVSAVLTGLRPQLAGSVVCTTPLLPSSLPGMSAGSEILVKRHNGSVVNGGLAAVGSVIRLIDLQGHVVISMEMGRSATSLDLGKVRSGLYVLHVTYSGKYASSTLVKNF